MAAHTFRRYVVDDFVAAHNEIERCCLAEAGMTKRQMSGLLRSKPASSSNAKKLFSLIGGPLSIDLEPARLHLYWVGFFASGRENDGEYKGTPPPAIRCTTLFRSQCHTLPQRAVSDQVLAR